jgi:DNA-binding LytR/AlgR family response regulator
MSVTKPGAVRESILCIKRKGEIIFLPREEIMMFYTDGHKVVAHTTAGDYEFVATLNEVEGKLNGDSRFLRTHQSYLVNVCMIERIVKKDSKKCIKFHRSDKIALLSKKVEKKLKETAFFLVR